MQKKKRTIVNESQGYRIFGPTKNNVYRKGRLIVIAFSFRVYRPSKMSLCYPDLLVYDAPAKEPKFNAIIPESRLRTRPFFFYSLETMELQRNVSEFV